MSLIFLFLPLFPFLLSLYITVCITTAFFCDVRKYLRATSAMMDVPTDRQSRSCQNLLS